MGVAQRYSLSTPKSSLCQNRLELLQCLWQVDTAAGGSGSILSSPHHAALPSQQAGPFPLLSSLWLINSALALFSESEFGRAWSLLTSARCSDFHCELSGDIPGNSVESLPSPTSSLVDLRTMSLILPLSGTFPECFNCLGHSDHCPTHPPASCVPLMLASVPAHNIGHSLAESL